MYKSVNCNTKSVYVVDWAGGVVKAGGVVARASGIVVVVRQ